MKIVLIINILDKMGGAERAFTNLANSLAKRNIEIEIISFDQNYANTFYSLLPSIKWHKIDDSKIIESKFFKFFRLRFCKRTFLLKQKIELIKPDAVISFINFTNIYSVIACRFLNIPIIISERSNPLKKRMPLRWELIRNFVYPLADRLVVQTNEVISCYKPKVQKICQVIPNIVLKPLIPENTVKNYSSPYILAVGRLRYVKGFDILIKSFNMVKQEFKDWKLVILGEGEERLKLISLIKDLNLQERIFLPGLKKELANDIIQSEFFVLSSRWEGFPNALAEAMALGKPVISSNCQFGPKEIITHDKNGLLFQNENIESLSNNLKILMSSPEKCSQLSQNAKEIVINFGESIIVQKWIDLLNMVIK